MKKTGFLLCWLLLLFMSCSQQDKDKGIKEIVSSQAKKEVAFAGVNYTVKDGVVTLSGNAPSDKDKQKVEDKVKNVSGVKEVLSQLVVAPVVLDGDFSLKQSVDSVLKKYPTTIASVLDSVITLQGEVENKELPELLKAINQLNSNGVNQQLKTH